MSWVCLDGSGGHGIGTEHWLKALEKPKQRLSKLFLSQDFYFYWC